MGVYFISAVTWIPDRWNHNQPSSLLMYNPQQAVTELYNSWTAPLQSLNFKCCRCKCHRFLIHLPWHNCLPSSGTTFVCLWPAFHGVPFCEPAIPCWWCYMVGEKKIERYSGKLEFFTACVNRNPSMPSFAATALVVFSFCGKVLWLSERRRTHKWQPRALGHSRAILRLLCEEQGL